MVIARSGAFLRTATLVSVLCAAALPADAQQRPDRAALAAALDSIARASLAGGRAAGLTVGVVKGSDTLLLKGYGYADLEHDVPTPDGAVYEIGSVTKQFTAAAVLRLREQGKLSLDDRLTKYLPDYPTQGRTITVRRLLDHTSGIKGYTEMTEFSAIMQRSLPRDTLVALFARQEFDFEPGEGQVYNNSAYFLLGLIIEKASGVPYPRYIEENVFARAGMRDSQYCSNSKVVKRRAHGYQYAAGELIRALYLDHTWPFSAGSLCSTAGDLLAWARALHGGEVLSPESYRELVAPGVLNDGTRLRYAKGLALSDILGHRAIHHGGGIPGFVSQLSYFPDDSLAVVVLLNTTGPVEPDAIARDIAQAVLGKREPTAVAFEGDLKQLEGSFRGVGRGRPLALRFALEGGVLTVRPDGEPRARPAALRYIGNDTFERESGGRFTFVRAGGKVTGVRADQVSVYSVLARQ